MARGIYAGMGARANDYVIYEDHRGRWRVDRVGPGGTHLTIGKTRGEESRTAAVALARDDARTRGTGTAAVFVQAEDGLEHFGNLIRGQHGLARDARRHTSRRDHEQDWHVLDVRTGCICPVGSQRAAEERAYQGNRSAGETRLIVQRSGCTTGRAPEERPIVFAAHDPARRRRRVAFVGARDARDARDPATRNADLVAWYRKHGELDMPRGFREEKIEWIRRTTRENAIEALRRQGYKG